MTRGDIRNRSYAGILCVTLCLATSLSFAGTITVTIDGVPPPTPSSGNCTNANSCVNIGGTYGVLAVTPVSGTCGSGSCARIDLSNNNENLFDTLRATNARITNTSGADKTFLLRAEREDIQLPGGSTTWYNTYMIGNFGAVANNSITSRSYYKPNGGVYGQIGSTLTYTVSCPLGICSTAFNKKTGSSIIPNTNPRFVKIELSITLKPNSYIDLNSGNTFTSSSTPPDDVTPVPTTPHAQCPTCTPRSQLSLFCATTHSTARLFGCPSCVTEDGQIAQDKKVKLFVLMNWDQLIQDMAQGKGDYLSSLATLLKIPKVEQPTFSAFAQTQHPSFSSEGVEHAEQAVNNLEMAWQSVYR